MRRAHDDKVLRLQALPAFAGRPARELRAIAEAADLVALDVGRTLLHGGHVPRGGALVLDGAVDLGLDRPTGAAGPGDFVGLDEVLGGYPAATDAVTRTPVTALVFTTPAIRTLFGSRRFSPAA